MVKKRGIAIFVLFLLILSSFVSATPYGDSILETKKIPSRLGYHELRLIVNDSNGYSVDANENGIIDFAESIVGGGSYWSAASLGIYYGGNVGIGESNPLRKLHISAPQDANIRLQDTSHADNGTAAYIEFYNETDRIGIVGVPGDTKDYLVIATEKGKDIVLSPSGNVGIGTTSPGQKLDVKGNVNATKYYGDGSALTGISTGKWDGTKPGNIYYNDGKVGIGTASPNEKLDVKGNLQMNSNYIKDSNIMGNTFMYQGLNILDAVYDKLIRADQKYTVTSDKPLRGGSIANMFDGHGSTEADWDDVDLPVAITIDLNGMRHYWYGFAIEFAYGRSVTGVKIEKFADAASPWSCADAVWSTVYENTTNNQNTIVARNNLGNGICKFRITLSGIPAFSNDIRIGEIGGWQYYYGSEGSFVRVTGDTMYGGLNVLNGSVGIGTTSPYNKLQVEGSIALATQYNSIGNGQSRYIGIPGSNPGSWSGAGAFIQFTQGGTNGVSNDIRFFTHKSGIFAGEAMRISESGNVGIGTTTPGQKLTVVGTANITGATYLGNSKCSTGSVLTASASTGLISCVANTGGTVTGSGISGNITKWTGTSSIGNSVMYENGGKIGIGTTSPGAKLDVAGVINGRNYAIPSSAGTPQWAKIGTFKAGQAGHTIKIVAYIHNGYNAINSQDSVYNIMFKTSNGATVDSNGFAGNGYWYAIGNNNAIAPGHIKWVANAAGVSATSYDLYIYLPSHTYNSHYDISVVDSASWTNIGSVGQSDPGAASSTVLIPSNNFNIPYGNVGIGTATPREKLDVAGNIIATGTICSEGGDNCVGESTSATNGMYIGWGEESCAQGYRELYQGWIYQAGQNNGYGGEIVCSKSPQGTVYTYTRNTYAWEFAPPCVVCTKDETVGQCYTNWGDTSCASGFNQKYSGKGIAAGQASGQWKTSLVCADSSVTRVYRHYSGYGWESSPACSVCCNDAAGGIFTKWGQYGTTTAPSCPSGYQTIYSGSMFQSGQRSGYGANAVCGISNAAKNEVYIDDGSAKWVTVPCSVCTKTAQVGNCFTAWGVSDLTSVPSGYSKIYSGNMYSSGVAAGDGGGLVCSRNSKTAVYVHDSSYKWEEYPCALYCTDIAGGQYTSWGTSSCDTGYTKVQSGYMYQGAQASGYGGELICSSGKQTQLYIQATKTSSYTWTNAPACAVCTKPSNKGICYTSFGSNKCAPGYYPVSEGNTFQGGVASGHGGGTVCSTNDYLDKSYLYNYYSGYGYGWEPGRPCAICCTLE